MPEHVFQAGHVAINAVPAGGHRLAVQEEPPRQIMTQLQGLESDIQHVYEAWERLSARLEIAYVMYDEPKLPIGQGDPEPQKSTLAHQIQTYRDQIESLDTLIRDATRRLDM